MRPHSRPLRRPGKKARAYREFAARVSPLLTRPSVPRFRDSPANLAASSAFHTPARGRRANSRGRRSNRFFVPRNRAAAAAATTSALLSSPPRDPRRREFGEDREFSIRVPSTSFRAIDFRPPIRHDTRVRKIPSVEQLHLVSR